MELSIKNPSRELEKAGAMEFLELSRFGPGGLGAFWAELGGFSPWELHPDCDELLYVLEGELEVEVLPPGDGPGTTAKVTAGDYIVVPQGCWHRQKLLVRSRELYVTPGPTLHSTDTDPRVTPVSD